MTTGREFLAAILPQEGLKCGVVLGGDRPRQRFFNTTDELADWLLTEDALGFTAYHACATYKTPDSRKATNALAAQSFWLDIDAGEDKPYANATAAWEAVEDFRQDVGLPEPIYVSSGRGLHVYWPLQEALKPEEWKVYADGLKQLCRKKGLQAGQERTGDVASILRPPGTHHRKADPILVRCGPLVGPYPVGDFEALRAVAPPARTQLVPLKTSPLTSALGNIYEPRYAEQIANGCAVVHQLRELRGNVAEPLWYDILGVLAYCADGEEKAQLWSSGYPKYSPEETARKLEQVKRRTSGPTTCAHFEGVAHDVCWSCPLHGKITSPIQAGRDQPWTQEERSESSASSSPLPSSSLASSPVNKGGIDLPALPTPFGWDKAGKLICTIEDRNGKEVAVIVSEHAIFLESMQVKEIQRGQMAAVFKQYLPQEGWIDIALSAKTLMSSNGIAEMFGAGAVIRDRKLFTEFVVLSMERFHHDKKSTITYEQCGWKDNNTAFLWGNNYFKDGTIKQVVAGSEVRNRSTWLQVSAGASATAWRDAVGQLFVTGFEPHCLAILASFAAPLMRFNSDNEGGAILSLVSMQSGTGKSVALDAAASVWGQKRGTDLTEIDTQVSKALTLAALGNLPAIYDELAGRNPEVCRDFVMMFTNGRDKMRGTQDGNVRHLAAQWQTVLLTASNQSLVEALTAAASSEAPSLRVFELIANRSETMAQQAGERLKKTFWANAGVAGKRYLEYLTQPSVVEALPGLVLDYTETIWKQSRLKPEYRFWVRLLAGCALAASILEKLEILPFKPMSVVTWALERAQEMAHIDEPEIPGSASIGILSAFLSEHMNAMLVVNQGINGRTKQVPVIKPTGHLLAVRYELDSGRLAISMPVFKMWALKRGAFAKEVLKELGDKGLVIHGHKALTLGAGTEYPTGQTQCVVLDGAHPLLSGTLREVQEPKEKRVG